MDFGLGVFYFPTSHANSQEYLLIKKYLPGIVPSSVVLTAFQVMSRVFLTWAVTHSVKEVSQATKQIEKLMTHAAKHVLITVLFSLKCEYMNVCGSKVIKISLTSSFLTIK